jgi:hypothetical protein
MEKKSMSDVEHTYVDTNNGLGGPALGAGFGGLIGSWFGQGMNGGWGGNGNWANNTFLANQMSAIQSQAVSNGLATQQAVNSAAQTTTEAINSNGRDTNNAIYQSNLANVQGQGATQLGIANTGANLTQGIMSLGANLAQAIAQVNQNITNQGYEARLQAQQLTGVLTAQHAELLKAISDENCKDRELMRQIQTEGISSALLDAKSQVNILKQTQDIVNQLKTTTTAG